MKRLNPLYIILLFLVIAFISIFMLKEQKNILTQKVNELANFEVKTKDFKDLKASWTNKDFINRNLDLILKNRMFVNQKILRADTKESIKIKIESNDPKVLDSFLNKILNKEFIIKGLEVEKTFINLEIGTK
jgi:hypothetical protein